MSTPKKLELTLSMEDAIVMSNALHNYMDCSWQYREFMDPDLFEKLHERCWPIHDSLAEFIVESTKRERRRRAA